MHGLDILNEFWLPGIYGWRWQTRQKRFKLRNGLETGPFVEVFMVRCLIYGKNTFRHRNRGAAQRSERTCYTAEEPQQQTNKQRGN